MAVLEDVGLLEKTHTSSGRIPKQKRVSVLYVEHLMEKELDSNVKYSLQQVFSERHYSMDEIVKKSCDILSQMTHLTSVVLGPESKYQTLQHIQLVSYFPAEVQLPSLLPIMGTPRTRRSILKQM